MDRLMDKIKISLLQAVVAGGVVWLWSLVMSNIEHYVNADGQTTMIGMIILPLIFMITATLSAGSVLGYPLFLAWKGNWKTAITILLLTVLWLAIFSIILVIIY